MRRATDTNNKDLKGRILYFIKTVQLRHIILIAPSRSGHTWTMGMVQSWLPGDIVHNFESIPPVIYSKRVHRDVFYGSLPKHDQPVIALTQVRDFLNYAASWTKHKLNLRDAHRQEAVTVMYEMWMDMTKETLGDTEHIKDKKITLYYDRFVQDENYRRELCDLLGGEYSEDMIDNVPANSPGSSFDKYDYQGRAHQMDVLNRWKWFLSEEGAPFIFYLKAARQVLEYYAARFDLDEEKKDFITQILN